MAGIQVRKKIGYSVGREKYQSRKCSNMYEIGLK
jgi:hypothetical protein